MFVNDFDNWLTQGIIQTRHKCGDVKELETHDFCGKGKNPNKDI